MGDLNYTLAGPPYFTNETLDSATCERVREKLQAYLNQQEELSQAETCCASEKTPETKKHRSLCQQQLAWAAESVFNEFRDSGILMLDYAGSRFSTDFVISRLGIKKPKDRGKEWLRTNGMARLIKDNGDIDFAVATSDFEPTEWPSELFTVQGKAVVNTIPLKETAK